MVSVMAIFAGIGVVGGMRSGATTGDVEVVDAQASGGECCPRYDVKVHIPAEEWSPTSLVRQIHWKAPGGIASTVVPLWFSVEYCAGLNLEGPCSSYVGEITIDGVLQELGSSNGGGASWPLPDCGNGPGVCGDGSLQSPFHPCKLVELEVPSTSYRLSADCGYFPEPTSNEPCFNDSDHRLTIAEKIFQGQTKRFRRVFFYQHPGADPTTGAPPRLIQRIDASYMDGTILRWQCGPDIDQYFMISQPWVTVYKYQFGDVVNDDCWEPNCHREYEFCFPYRFFPLP